MNDMMRIPLLLLLSIMMALVTVHAAEPIKIGVLAFRPKPQTLQQWQPLAVALKQALPEQDFLVEAYTFHELEGAVATKQVDFVLTNPGHYVMLTRRIGLSAPLATLSVDQNGQPSSLFGGVIFTRAGQANIDTLSDIKGKTVATVSTDSFGGYQMQAYELIRFGIDLPKDTHLISTNMPHDNVVAAVLTGHAEVGFVRTGVLEAMVREGTLNLNQLKVLNPQAVSGSQLLLSTQLYPEWAFAVMPHVDSKLARHVAAALYVLEDNTAAVKAMNIHGFVVPPNYSPVADLLKALRLPPFDAMPTFTLRDVWKRYLWQIMLALYAITLIVLLGVRLFLVRRKLQAQHGILLQQKHQLQLREAHLNAIIENEPECIKIVDADGNLVQMNPAGLRMVECENPQQVLGKPVEHIVAPEYRRDYADMHQRVLAGSSVQMVFEIIGLKGSRRWMESHGVPLQTDSGLLQLAVARDISERKQAEDALRDSHRKMDLLLNSMAEGAYGVDTRGNCTFVNRSFLHILGYDSSKEVIGRHMHDLIHYAYPDGSTYPESECRMYGVLRSKQLINCADEVFWRKDGRAVPVEYWIQPIETDDEIRGAVVTFVDITERRQAQEAIRQSELKFHTLFDSTNDAVLMLDASSCLDCNKATLILFGCTSREDICYHHIARLSLPLQPDGSDSVALIEQHIDSAMQHGSARFEWVYKRFDTGLTFSADVQLSSMVLDGRQVIQATIRDISERKKMEEQVHRLAFYDPLTQLANRRLLSDRLSQNCAINKRRGYFSALIFIDLDNFKPLNDNHGHAVGDLLLIDAANRLKQCVREMDTVARFGGDEFVVLLSDLSSDQVESKAQAAMIAEKIRAALSVPYQLEIPYDGTVEQHVVCHVCTASIGVAVFGNQTSRTADLLKWADNAMYKAKKSGRNQIRVHEGSDVS